MKYLLMGISYLFGFLNKSTNANELTPFIPLITIKNLFKKEISLVMYKALLGLLLVSIIVLCLNQSGKSFSIIMSQIEYGYIVEFLIFMAIAIGSGFFLHRIFSSDSHKSNSLTSEEEMLFEGIDLKALKTTLIKGFLEGIESNSSDVPPPSASEVPKHPVSDAMAAEARAAVSS